MCRNVCKLIDILPVVDWTEKMADYQLGNMKLRKWMRNNGTMKATRATSFLVSKS